MLEHKRNLNLNTQEWMKKGVMCWIYNDNVLPSKKVFF